MALVCSAHRTEINLLRQTLDRLIYHQQALDQLGIRIDWQAREARDESRYDLAVFTSTNP